MRVERDKKHVAQSLLIKAMCPERALLDTATCDANQAKNILIDGFV